MLAALSLNSLSYAPALAPAGRSDVKMSFTEEFSFDAKPWSGSEIQDQAGLADLAKKLNPTVGYWDPLNIGASPKETIGWFRHAEIKHGRVAMAGFIGYCVQANGIHFPWNIQAPFGSIDVPTIGFGDISAAGGPADQWDALPTPAKLQILGVVGFLEVRTTQHRQQWPPQQSPCPPAAIAYRFRPSLSLAQMFSETSAVLKMDGQAHYVRGGKPGYFPALSRKDEMAFPHPVPLNLWDPFGFTKKMTPERKEKALLAEVNNGRLAMLGIFGMISASKGLQVPGLDGLGLKQYSGEYMAPFASGDISLPFVQDMLPVIGSLGYKI